MKTISNTALYLLTILAGFLLVVFGISFWLNNTIFNEQVFLNKTVAVLTSEQAIQNLSAGIVDKSLENAPTVRNLFGNKLQGVVSGLLSTDSFADVVRGAAGRIYAQITSQNPKGVVINTQGVKALVTPILSVVATPEQKDKLADLHIPDEIVLVDPSNVPSIYYLTGYLWIWSFALAGSIGLLAYVIYASAKENRLRNTQFAAGIVAIIMALAAGVIPSIEPAIIRNIQNVNLRSVAGNIYESLVSQLFNIYTGIAIFAIVVIIGIFAYQLFVKWQSNKAQTKK